MRQTLKRFCPCVFAHENFRYGSEIEEFEDKNRCFKAVKYLYNVCLDLCSIYYTRVSKEKISYEREVVTNENKLEKMKQEGKDEYEIKKQVRDQNLN